MKNLTPLTQSQEAALWNNPLTFKVGFPGHWMAQLLLTQGISEETAEFAWFVTDNTYGYGEDAQITERKTYSEAMEYIAESLAHYANVQAKEMAEKEMAWRKENLGNL